MKTESTSPIHRRIGYKNRVRCRILSATDLTWRLCEFLYAIIITFLPSMLNYLNQQSSINNGYPNNNGFEEDFGSSNSNSASTSSINNNNNNNNNILNRGGSKFLLLLGGGYHDKTNDEAHFEIMDTRVYDFLLNPILTLCYFVGFFLQISISFFLFCETSNYGTSASRQNEIAACKIWSRIAAVSLIILCLRFFLPYALLTFTNIAYNVGRVLFKIVGIIIVIIHAKELKSTLLDELDERDHDDYDLKQQQEEDSEYRRHQHSSRFSSFESSKSVFVEVELPLKSTATAITNKLPFLNKPKTVEYEKVKSRLSQVLAYIEKEMFSQALAELKIAQENLGYNSHLSNMEFIIQKMINIGENSKDYYKILGVPKNSTTDVVKSAYRRKSLRHHPDKHATEGESIQKIEGIRYLKIREAYETLSDPSKRSNYDDRLKLNKDKLNEFYKSLKLMIEMFN